MNPTITFTICGGSLDGREYTFDHSCHCVIGRSHDCDIQLPSTLEFLDISRHHCLLEIEPPDVHVRDLGSRNGTYLNGMKIGQRQEPWLVGGPESEDATGFELWDGDQLRIGHVTFRVCGCSPAAKPLEGLEVRAGSSREPAGAA